ncbi:DUF975 family protein [Clostridium culturomicium]|uniref:DUF975 family protein n=1 Tax=Clostridium culturomicium TaxID=1499683 RepID=UPI00058B7B0C|nr:DUF975 family protein [Clostridium culturomicium]
MWDRVQLKTKAKEVLKRNYWKAFLISFILMLVGGESSGGSNASNNSTRWNMGPDYISFDFIIGALAIIIIVGIVFSLIRIFLGYVVEVGGRKFFIRAAVNDSDMNYLGFGFSSTRYIEIIKTMFVRGILIFLWTLLLIIPGIVKSYAYRMVPYILADNPNIGYRRAIELSNEMTMGHKLDIFILDLSFMGWYLLGVLLFGIGTLFVRPYDDATNAELYLELRENAVRSGMCTCGELNLSSEEVFR